MKKAKTGSFTPLGFEFNKKSITILSIVAILLLVTITLSIALPLSLKTEEKTPETRYYNLSFDTSGLAEIESRTYSENDSVDSLPTLHKDKHMFLGWINKETGEAFVEGEKLKGNVVLTARFTENPELVEVENKIYVTFVDVDKDFSVLLDDTNNGLNAEQVKNGVKLTSITNPDSVDFTVYPEGDKFRLSSKTSFAEGGQYTLTIQNENVVFSEEPESVYIMYFNVKKAPVLNLSAKDGIIYLPISEISDFTGTLGGLFTVDETGVKENGDGGTFVFAGNGIKIGDTVAVFDKLNPNDISLDEDYYNNNVAYLKIVDIEGEVYTYVNPDAEDVIFKPDILPVDKTSIDLGENYLFADADYFDYSNSEYEQMGLNADTVVEKGDYIAVFEGESVLFYAVITQVEKSNSDVKLTFEKCTIEDLQASMDVYNTKNVDTEKTLDEEYLRENEKNLYDDLYQSGKLTNLAAEVCNDKIATDRFIRFCRDNDIDMTGLRFYAENNQVKAKSAKKVEVDPKFKIQLSTKLQHFKGENGEELSGLRCAIQINVEITFECGDGAEVSLEVSAVLVQEIRIAMNISGYAEWDIWFIFPYIKEYHFNASFEFYNYSAVDINIMIATKEPDEEWDDDATKKYYDFAQKLKDYLEKEEYYEEEIEGGVGGLADRYAEMLDIESDYVPIVEKTLFSIGGGIDPFHILCYKFEIKFVVGLNAQASLGVSFEYENAKRFVYSVELFSRNVKSDTIDIVEEAYSLETYAMGKIGLKVGFEASIELGLFSTDLDSIGLTAGVGAYADLYGYVYYSLEYSASEGKKTDFYGAMYFELGIYFDLSFTAQAFKGTFEYEKELLSYKWPLYSAGTLQNVLDFSLNNEGETISVELYGEEQSVKLDTDELFSLYYLNLAEGETDDEVYNSDRFDIALTNKNFLFNEYTGEISLINDSELIEDCKIILTYTGDWLSFRKNPIQLVVDVHWDRLDKEGYSISFESMGGSYASTIFAEYGEKIQKPKNPKKAGYDFAGWYRDVECTIPFDFPETMGGENILVYAGWKIRSDVEYCVQHMKESLESGKFELYETQTMYGTAFATIEAQTLNLDGFTSPTKQTVEIDPNGKTVVKYYYTRNSYTITLDPKNGEKVKTYSFKYGASVIIPKLIKTGYDFVSFDKDVPVVMPSNDIDLSALWTESENTKYTVEHYWELLTGDFELANGNVYYGKTNSQTAVVARDYLGFSVKPYEQENISGDGTTVVKLYYTRNLYTLTWILNTECGNNYTYGKVKYGDYIIPPEPERTGYSFQGFDAEVPVVMPALDVTITAIWQAENSGYKVEHLLERVDGEYTVADIENLKGLTDDLTQAVVKEYTGFSATDFEQTIISAYGDSVVKIYYVRNSYTLTWNLNGGEAQSETKLTLKYQQPIEEIDAVYEGYTFVGYEETLPSVMPANDITVNLVWRANTNTAYTVNHLCKDLSKETYTLYERETLYGETDSLSSAVSKSIDGFTSNSFNQQIISGNGAMVLNIYYDRNKYTVTWLTGDAIPENDYTNGLVEFGLEIIVPALSKIGYELNWDKTIPQTMPSNDLTFTAVWTAVDVEYRVNHYLEKLTSGEYDLSVSKTLKGKTDTLTKAESDTFNGFSVSEFSQENISGDGSTVVNIYYTRNSYELSWNGNGVELSGDYTSGSVKFGTPIVAPTLEKTGYTLSWNQEIPQTMPSNDLTFTAVWLTAPVDYNVEYFIKEVGKDSFVLESSATLRGETDSVTNVLPKTIIGFTANEIEQKVISGDGSTVVKVYYVRNKYTLSWNFVGTDSENEYTFGLVEFETPIIAPLISKEGYSLSWDKDVPSIMPNSDLEISAIWSAVSVNYTVNHYTKRLGENSYELYSSETLSGKTDSLTNAESKKITGFTAKEFEQQTILGNGSSVVDLYYDRNVYTVSFVVDGNETTADMEYGEKIVPPQPEKAGYTLSWDKVVPEFVGDENLEFNAVWTANEDTAYSVKHFKTELAGNLTLIGIQTLYGTTDTYTNAEANVYKGFTVNDFEQQSIKGDNSTVIEIIYKRNQYTVTVDLNGGEGDNSFVFLYGEDVEIDTARFSKEGYAFQGFIEEIPETMPYENLTITAVWTAKTDTAYTVNHYLQNVDNAEYTLYTTENKQGTTNEQTNATALVVNGYSAVDITQKTINANGTTVINVYYNRNIYTLTFVTGLGDDVVNNVFYLSEISVPSLTKAGYILSWDKEIPETMPYENLTITAVWTARNDIPYTVNYYTEELNGSYSLSKTESLVGTTDALTEVVPEEFTGFTLCEFDQAIVSTNGNTCVDVRYSRNSYVLAYTASGGTITGDYTVGNVKYGSPIVLPVSGTRTGYIFNGVNINVETMPAYNLTVNVLWSPIRYTIRFDRNGGSGTISEITALYDTNISLPNNGFSKTGYNFVGYSLTPDGSKTYSCGSSYKNLVSENNGTITLYAYYSPITYEVKFDPNHVSGASGSPSSWCIATYDRTFDCPNVSSSATGTEIVLKGWSKTKDGNVITSFMNLSETQDAVITLYAIWMPKNNNTSEFDGGDGSTIFPFRISNATHFQNIVNYDSSRFILVSDITINNHMVSGTFSGVLDGQGHTISGSLSISSSGSGSQNTWIGPISYNKGLIKNVVSTVNVTLTNTSTTINIVVAVGGIAGNNAGTIENCTVHDATLTSNHTVHMGDNKNSYAVAGAISGLNSNTIQECVAYKNTIYANNDSTDKCWGYYYAYAGGISGQSNGGSTIKYCMIYSNQIKARAASGGDPGWFEKTYIHAFAGGIVGKFNSGSNEVLDIYVGGNIFEANIHNYCSTSYKDNNKSGSGLIIGHNDGATLKTIYGKQGDSGSCVAMGTSTAFSGSYGNLNDVAKQINSLIEATVFTVVNGNVKVRTV